jgi:carboxylesterase
MQRSVNEKPFTGQLPQSSEHEFYFEGSREQGVLLIHGLTAAPVEMRFVGKMLNRMGFTVYAPVLAGHCQDIPALEATTYEDWIDSLRGPLDWLKLRVRHVHTAGICVGGVLGLMLAHQERGKVDKSVLYSPALIFDGWNKTILERIGQHLINPLKWASPLHHLRFKERSPFGIKDERMRRFIFEGASLKGVLDSTPVFALYQNLRLIRALEAALPRMTVPTLLLHALDDDVSHPRNAVKIKRLHGGQCELRYLHDSYHLIHIDRERELVAKMTADFMGIPASPAPAPSQPDAA